MGLRVVGGGVEEGVEFVLGGGGRHGEKGKEKRKRLAGKGEGCVCICFWSQAKKRECGWTVRDVSHCGKG